MEKDPVSAFVHSSHKPKPVSKFWGYVAGFLAVPLCTLLGSFMLWNSWDTLKPVANPMVTEGVVVRKYLHERNTRRMRWPAPIIIYSYENPYWEGRPKKIMRLGYGASMAVDNGRAGRQEVSKGFYQKTNIGDVIPIKYSANEYEEQSAIRGGFPLKRILFEIFCGLFLLGLSLWFSIAMWKGFPQNKDWQPNEMV